MISVIIPFYNSERSIERCLDSLLSQSYNDFEIILVDDGSTDCSLKIANRYTENDNRIRVFHKDNGGVSSTRNRGIEEVKGEFITFVDSDDWVEPDYLMNYIKGQEGEQLCIQNMTMHSGDNIYTPKLEDKIITDRMGIIKTSYLFGSTCNTLFHTKIINDNKIRFDERISMGEDTDVLMRYLNFTNKVRISAKSTYNYIQPDATKEYDKSNLLYSRLKLFDDLVRISRDLTVAEQIQIRDAECRSNIDWAIEGLFYCKASNKEELKHLVLNYTIYFHKFLSESHRQSFRHRLFKRICKTSKPETIRIISRFVMLLQRILTFIHQYFDRVIL